MSAPTRLDDGEFRNILVKITDNLPHSLSSPSSTLVNLTPPRKAGHWRLWQRQIRYLYVKLLRLQSTPHALARGLAVGSFAGMFPFFGLQTAIALVLAIPLRGNKIVAAGATWISNPFTYVPIYWFNYRLGLLLLQREGVPFNELDWQSTELLKYGGDAAIALLVGSLVAGAGVGLTAYVFGLRSFTWIAIRKQKSKSRGR
ncbi:DUF2062 domain-containing protein [Synechocystis sp. PCC 7339]|nr:DUF2062 domain-containing protein [Synechocystis sp. PCC 7338]UAJ74314.1 DUF2062 domain-containing protein [Synechocystis sp. PCC 7339]